jgi:hypothetical protein
MGMHLLQTAWKKLSSFVPPRDEEFRLARRLDRARPVLIYQMGKVGSSSLKKSRVLTWPGLTIHTHNIAKDKANKAEAAI